MSRWEGVGRSWVTRQGWMMGYEVGLDVDV
jgi:hypothetical protein